VQPPPLGLNRAAWETALRATAPTNSGWTELDSEVELRARTEQLVATKYSQDRYNQKR
jgi:hypothetical protein